MQLARYIEDDDCTTTLDLTGSLTGSLILADAVSDVEEAKARVRRGDLAGAEFWLSMANEVRDGR